MRTTAARSNSCAAAAAPHLGLELLLEAPVAARQEVDDLVDQRAVVLLGDVADARRQAALDVVVEARDAGRPARLGPLAGTAREDPPDQAERVAHLVRVREGPEVEPVAAVALAREVDARVLLVEADRDVGVALVVAQPDVEGRAVELDQVPNKGGG